MSEKRCRTCGNVARNRYYKRVELVKHKLASWYMPYRPLSEVLDNLDLEV